MRSFQGKSGLVTGPLIFFLHLFLTCASSQDGPKYLEFSLTGDGKSFSVCVVSSTDINVIQPNKIIFMYQHIHQSQSSFLVTKMTSSNLWALHVSSFPEGAKCCCTTQTARNANWINDVQWWRRRWLRDDRAEYEHSQRGRPEHSCEVVTVRSWSWQWPEHRVLAVDPLLGRGHCVRHSATESARPRAYKQHGWHDTAILTDGPTTTESQL